MNYLQVQICELRGELGESEDREKVLRERLTEQEDELEKLHRRMNTTDRLVKVLTQWCKESK
jgi:hypothetical protein